MNTTTLNNRRRAKLLVSSSSSTEPIESLNPAANGLALEYHQAIYIRLLDALAKIDPLADPVAFSYFAGRVAHFATHHHSGCFCAPEIENGLLSIGQNLHRFPLSRAFNCEYLPWPKADGRRHLLHVATVVQPTGGHTRLIENWIKTDTESLHSLFLTQQGRFAIRDELLDAINAQGGSLIVAPESASDFERAVKLRDYASRSVNQVILHHHSDDTVPVLALADDNCPPVAILNHADHLFWLGSSVADAVISLREIGAELSSSRRQSRRELVLPIPLAEGNFKLTRSKARAALSIPEQAIVFLSVGRPEKYVASSSADFFHTAAKLLDQVENSQLIVIGPTRDKVVGRIRAEHQHRIILPGPVTNTSDYRIASDIYVESFPFGSHTAALEAALAALPIVLAYTTPTPLLASDSEGLNCSLVRPSTEEQYLNQAIRLATCTDSRLTLGKKLQQTISKMHCGLGWFANLRSIYQSLDSLNHQSKELELMLIRREEIDAKTAQWQWEMYRDSDSTSVESSVDHWLKDAAYQLRNLGCYRVAARMLVHAAKLNRKWSAVAGPLAKLVPHWFVRKFKY